jgi:predicted AlkP superfamily pyrophosphatase or phosphodiesterase
MDAAARANPDLIERAVRALLDPALEPLVEMVLTWRDGCAEAHAVDGSVTFTGDGRIVATSGRNPLARQDPSAFAPLAEEQAARRPDRAENAYPFAYEHVAQLFADPDAPDVCVVRTAAHHAGHAGEHGSPGVVQARAPLVLAGPGVRRRGAVPEAARVVDVAPTLAAVAGAEMREADGEVLEGVLDDATRPDHVVAFLLDGTNANVFLDAVRRGELPNLRRLVDAGTTYAHGAMASLPTITLANRTAALTGRHPGHHGILHNAWWDRRRRERVVTNSMATWPFAMQRLRPGVDTLHAAVHRAAPDAFTAAVNEPCDTGADYSSFAFLRAGELIPFPERADDLPHASADFVRTSKDYAWHTMVDHLAVEQAVGIWDGHYRGEAYPPPRLCWVSFSLTDAAFHEGGPYSDRAAAALRDTDGRVGEILAAVERAGAFERTAFAVLADHGMEEADAAVTGDWGPALADAGIPHRDEALGFVYLGEEVVGP